MTRVQLRIKQLIFYIFKIANKGSIIVHFVINGKDFKDKIFFFFFFNDLCRNTLLFIIDLRKVAAAQPAGMNRQAPTKMTQAAKTATSLTAN